MFARFCLVSFLFFMAPSIAQPPTYLPCDQDPARRDSRSNELRQLMTEDQSDRLGTVDWNKVQLRDEARRKRVGEIFGEGCFSSARDFASAALIYQHGNVPEHFFQTFLWAKQAVALGDKNSEWLVAAGIDRYLVKSGRKQLFATQATKLAGESCWCLEAVESTFPEEQRKRFSSKSIKEKLDWVDVMNREKVGCQPARFCEHGLKDSPAGTVPSFW